jgi:hypothetical protein
MWHVKIFGKISKMPKCIPEEFKGSFESEECAFSMQFVTYAFASAIQKHDDNIQKHNFSCCAYRGVKFISHIKERSQTDRIWRSRNRTESDRKFDKLHWGLQN